MKPSLQPRIHGHPRPARAFGSAALGVLLALAPGATVLGAEQPGPRLFTTAEQRAHLDRVRHEAPVEPKPDTAPAQAPTPPKPPAPVHLRGFVRRSGGPEAVWVNDDSPLGSAGLGGGLRGGGGGIDDGEVDAGRVEGNDVVIRLRDGRTIRLKPGQTWDPERGVVRDVLGR